MEADDKPALTKPVNAVIAATQILQYLAKVGEPVGATHVAKETKLHASTCFNILRTLTHENLTVFDKRNKTYRLGLGIFDIARGALAYRGVVGVAEPYLEELAQRYDLTATLWRRVDGHIVLIAMSLGTATAMRIQMSLGQRLPEYIGAVGRSLAAGSHIERATLKQRFSVLRWQTPPTFEEYLAGVEEARARGYALDSNQFTSGVSTIAAAVPPASPGEDPALSIAAVMFTGQHNGEVMERIGEQTLELARLLGQAVAMGGGI